MPSISVLINPKEFPIPVELKQYIVDAYFDDQTNYPAADGMLELRNAVSNLLKERSITNYSRLLANVKLLVIIEPTMVEEVGGRGLKTQSDALSQRPVEFGQQIRNSSLNMTQSSQ